jgi:hypothetical protein
MREAGCEILRVCQMDVGFSARVDQQKEESWF